MSASDMLATGKEETEDVGPYRLLLVEDDDAKVAAVTERFRHFGIVVDAATNDEQAEALSRSTEYDAIFVDQRLEAPRFGEPGDQWLRARCDRFPGALKAIVTAYPRSIADAAWRTLEELGVDVVEKAAPEEDALYERLLESARTHQRGTRRARSRRDSLSLPEPPIERTEYADRLVQTVREAFIEYLESLATGDEKVIVAGTRQLSIKDALAEVQRGSATGSKLLLMYARYIRDKGRVRRPHRDPKA